DRRLTVLCFLVRPKPPLSNLFPYTTLFRSCLPKILLLQVGIGKQEVRAPFTWYAFSRLCAAAAGSPWRNSNSPRASSDRSCEGRSEEHTSELQSPYDLVCRLLLEKKNITKH